MLIKVKKLIKGLVPLTANRQLSKFDNLERKFEKIEAEQKKYFLEILCQQKKLIDSQKNLFNLELNLKRKVQELTWAIIFQDTVKNSWLSSTNLSLGRWAIGYPFAYILFRTLEAQKPINILELGLGESTKIVLSYKEHSLENISHTIVEESKDWLNFFSKNNKNIIKNSELIQLDYEFCHFRNFDNIRVFKNFKEKLKGRKFDLICIDAPLGGDMKEICRVDILSIIPDSLADSFVILLDDFHRSAEKKLAELLFEKLDKHQISYVSGVYDGDKSVLLIASPDLSYLSSL